jgi:hypothetical protein
VHSPSHQGLDCRWKRDEKKREGKKRDGEREEREMEEWWKEERWGKGRYSMITKRDERNRDMGKGKG